MNFRSFYRIFFCARCLAIISQHKCAKVTATLSIFFIGLGATAQTHVENTEQLREKIVRFLTDEYMVKDVAKVDIKLSNLDNRLQLAACAEHISFRLQDPTQMGGNVSVQVVCNGQHSWTILIPLLAKIYRPVATAGRNLQKGEVIAASDLTTDIKDIGEYRMGFVLNANDIINKEVKYPIVKGSAFRNSSLSTPLVIKRGDEVSLEAGAGSLKVVTKATAVSDGRVGQQIRVKNTKSERIINAKVVAAGKVQSIL